MAWHRRCKALGSFVTLEHVCPKTMRIFATNSGMKGLLHNCSSKRIAVHCSSGVWLHSYPCKILGVCALELPNKPFNGMPCIPEFHSSLHEAQLGEVAPAEGFDNQPAVPNNGEGSIYCMRACCSIKLGFLLMFVGFLAMSLYPFTENAFCRVL